MPKQTSSCRALCQALLLIAAIIFQGFPLSRNSTVFARLQNGGQRKTLSKTKIPARPQRTPAPDGLSAVNITATNRDTFPNHGDGMAHAGDTITYTVTVTNNGDVDAVEVFFSDVIDANTSTLVPSSAAISPVVVADTFSALGNVRLDTANIPGAAGDVRNNDILNGGTLSGFGATLSTANATAIGGTVTTAAGSTVVLNAGGTFTFNPPAGFTGSDSFFYTATNSVGPGTGKVTVDVSDRIWFVNSAAAPGGDGRLTSPFNCLVGAGCFDTVAADTAGDAIFLYSGNYTGGLSLLDAQFLVGQGASDSVAAITGLTVPSGSDPLPATGGPAPVITTVAATTNGINLTPGTNVTIRGVNIGNTTGAKIASGASFGTLTLGNVLSPDIVLSGNGAALNLTNGTFGATSGVSSLTTTGSAGQGVALSGVAGSVSFGSTTVSGNTTQCILVSASTANINFGNTSCLGGTDGVSLQNNPSGTRTFGTLTVSGASGNAFLHAVGGGNTTVNGAANLSSTNNPIQIQNAGSVVINFAGNTSATRIGTGGVGVNLTSNTGATMTFNSLAIVTSSGTGLSATGGGTINVTNGVGAINPVSQPAPAVIANGVTLNANFLSTSSSGGANGVSLTNVTGTSNFGTGSITGSTGSAFAVSGGNPTLTYNGNITQNNAQRVVDVQNTAGGSVSFSAGTITGGPSSTGVIINAANGNVSFANLNHGAVASRASNQAVTITGGSGTYSLGAVNIFTSGAKGIVVSNADGTLNSTAGTVDALNGTAIDIDGPVGLTTLGMTLTRVDSSGGSDNGIIIRDTNGAFAVQGTVAAPGSGGTIASKTGANASQTQGSGVFLSNVTNISLNQMQLNDFQNFAIRGLNVTGFTLNSCVINASGSGTNGNVQGEGGIGEGSIRFDNLLGTASIADSTITHGVYDNLGVFNTSGTLNRLTVSNTNFATTTNTNTGNDAVRMEASGSGTVMNATFNSDCDFTAARGDLIDIIAQVGSTVDIDVIGNDFNNSHSGILSGGGGTIFHGGGTMTFNIEDNDMSGARGRALNVSKSATAGNFSGFINNNRIGIQGSNLSGSTQGSGIFVDGGGAGLMTVAVTNNVVREYNEAGIFLIANNQTLANNNGTMNSTVTGNTTVPFSGAGSFAFAGIFADVGTGVNGDATFGCMNIGGTSQNDFSAGDPSNASDINLSVQLGSTMRLPGYGGPNNNAGQITSYLQGRNLNPAATTVTLSFTGTMTGGAACTQPVPSAPVREITRNQSGSRFSSPVAISNLASAIIDAAVAITIPRVITPTESKRATLEGRVNNKPEGFIASNVAEGYQKNRARLHHAVRRATASRIGPLTPQSGGTVNFNVGTLSGGSSVTITFQVTVNSSAPLGVNQISNQGTVSGGNFAPVLTDDPDTAQPDDPTLTPLLHPTAAEGIITGRVLTEEGRAVEGVVVRLNGAQSRKTITDADGKYTFEQVEPGGLYTVTPARANYNFNPFERSFNQLSNRTEASFTGLFTADTANPLDTTEYFIRQQYVDILGREPDEGGFNYWSNRILECLGDELCINSRRREVAAAFFIEQEFQRSGSFIHNLYKAVLSRQPLYNEYSADRQLVVGGATLEADKLAFVKTFVQRAEFLQRYQSNATAESFVDALLTNVLQTSGVDLSGQRDSLVSRYNTGANQIESRSLVVRDVGDNGVLRQAEYNPAFVLTEYFGYLRRDPDAGGYAFWLDVLNNRAPGNYHSMVCAFITSTEYQRRFSAIVSRSNSDCGR